jgi:Tfp pilus assembly protein PilV
MRIKKYRHFFSLLRNERGVSLIEVLASSFIFLMIVIPLCSVYVNGIQIYQDTSYKTALRNEANFLIADIMRKIQESSYFEIADIVNEEKDASNKTATSYLIDIINNRMNGEISADEADSVKRMLVMYMHTVGYKNDATISQTVRKTFRFQQPNLTAANSSEEFFTYTQSYVAEGLFRISGENRNKLILYLVISPREGDNLLQNLSRINSQVQNGDTDLIQVIRTEIDVNSSRKG